MKKVLIPILSALLVATVITGCRKNVATETTPSTTQATKPATTAPTTRPTETTRHTEPPHSTGTMPSILPGTTDATGSGSAGGATGESGRSRSMLPQY